MSTKTISSNLPAIASDGGLTKYLLNQIINKPYKDLKSGITLNQNDLTNFSLKDLWKLSFSEEEINSNMRILRKYKKNRVKVIKIYE